MGTVYVCDSTVCPLRSGCKVQNWTPGTDVHITHFRPQEEFSGECPHYLPLDRDAQPARRPW